MLPAAVQQSCAKPRWTEDKNACETETKCTCARVCVCVSSVASCSIHRVDWTEIFAAHDNISDMHAVLGQSLPSSWYCCLAIFCLALVFGGLALIFNVCGFEFDNDVLYSLLNSVIKMCKIIFGTKRWLSNWCQHRITYNQASTVVRWKWFL